MSAAHVSDRHRAEHAHRYVDPRTGLILPYSVTGIIGSYAGEGKVSRMCYAAVKLTRERQDYLKVWGAKRDLGTLIHGHLSDWAEGKGIDLLPQHRPYMNAVSAFMKGKKPEWLEVERHLVIGGMVGGRFDAVVYLAADGLYYLIDAKTGKVYLYELILQLAAYSMADGMIVYDKHGKAIDLEPLPHIDRFAGLYLTDENNGTATFIDKKPNGAPLVEDEDREAFMHLLAVRQRADAVKGK